MSTVTEYLAGHDLYFVEIGHPRSYTSLEEARALGIEPGEVAKALVLDTGGGHVLAVIPASKRLDLQRAREVLGPDTQLASEREISRDLPGFELGAIPPIGDLVHLPVYIDPELEQHDTVVFAAGTQTGSVRMRLADLIGDRNARVVPLT